MATTDTIAERMSDADIEVVRAEVERALDDFDTRSQTRNLLETTGKFDRTVWSVAAELGWLAASVPEALGGLGMGLEMRSAIAEELGRRLASIPFAVHTAVLSVLAQAKNGVKETLIAEGIAGTVVLTAAVFEAGESAVPARPFVRFDGRVVSGEKVAVCAGAFADYALVLCERNTLALVDLRQSAVERLGVESIDNGRGYATLVFDGAEALPVTGDCLFDLLLDELAVLTAFEQIGGAASCLSTTRDYALERRAFGQPIGAFQAVKHGLADFYVLIQIARGAALASLDATPEEMRLAAASARLAATRAYDHCAQEAIQLHGGIGATWEADLHLHLRRSRCLAQEWGGPVYWRERLLQAFEERGGKA